ASLRFFCVPGRSRSFFGVASVMNGQPHTTGPSAETPLAELFKQFLERQVSAHSAGLAPADDFGEVEPYDVSASQPVDPRLAWDEAMVALKTATAPSAAFDPPPEWSTLVASHEPVVALPLCVGNFPQLLRNLHKLLLT